MATKVEPEYPPSPNEDSDGDGAEEEPVDTKPKRPLVASNVAELLSRLHSSGAILKKPKQEHRCRTCNEDFPDWETLENHLIQHVSLPSVVITKLPSDDEDGLPSGDDWSDAEDETLPTQQKTPQKLDISQIMKKTGISITSPVKPPSNANSTATLSKLTGLGFTIKKNSTPIKDEKSDNDESSNVMQKLGKLGGIKLKLKSDSVTNNSFQVVNGLKDFKTSDDDDEDEKEDQSGESGDDQDNDKANKLNDSDEQEAPDNRNSDDEDEVDLPLSIKKSSDAKKYVAKNNLANSGAAKPIVTKAPIKIAAQSLRPVVKLTPRRGDNVPIAAKPAPKGAQPAQGQDITKTHDSSMDNVVVKQEAVPSNEPTSTVPLFSGQIKTERSSPTPIDTNSTTPMIAQVKTELDTTNASNGQPLFQNISQPSSAATEPLLAVPKKEDTGVTVIEINGDSDGDDDCCVVSATPAPDIKPIIPKPETLPTSFTSSAFPTSQPSFTTSSTVLSSRLTAPSTEKQHSFNWNAPDSKPPIDMLEKSTDDLFDTLFSTKRENLADASEYISLDTLGPQHSCEVCNTRFTSFSLLDDHKRMTGHSSSLVMPSSSSTLLPYSPSSNILSTLLPVKQLAEQVGKLSAMGNSGPGFSHQQNVMINIQTYPGAGGVMGPPPSYNSYGSGQNNMHSGYQPPNSMYGSQGIPGQSMPGQYQGQNFMGQQGFTQQYGQQPMPQPGFAGSMPPPYSTASPLQNMQQSVYGQSSGLMNTQVGQMGPPLSSPSHPYVPASSPSGVMKPPSSSAIRIQNVQTFPPGQLIGAPVQQSPGSGQGPGGMTATGQPVGNQMPAPGPIRMAAGANINGPRPRMPGVRGTRPSIRPGIQVHGQVRGAKPRMPIKRPAAMAGGPGQKRRTDMLLPGKHDNEDCQVMAMQKQRQGLPLIESVQGAKDKLNLGSQISITKKTVNKEANAMANVLASRGISIKQKQKSRSPSPERPIPHIPNLGAGVSIKHTSKSSNFSIPEAKVGVGMQSCKICNRMFMNSNSLAVHMDNAHPQSKQNMYKCEECPAGYPKAVLLERHMRTFHHMSGPNRELGLPVVDLSQDDTVKRLSNIGIYSFIPLANREQGGGSFGIPVISVHNMQNGITSGLQALGADGLLSLGPLKPLPNT